MKPITFCIASAKNEKEYTKLLLRSLKEHTQIDLHEILIFIDSDNQNTYEELVSVQNTMPNLKIYRNTRQFPIGSQRNVTLMFNAASNDVVCYLQSDMVVGKDFDKHISNNIDENTVLACARIEPPLHPGSPEKIVKDFGITPQTFQYEAFNQFVDQLQSENRPNMIGHFAPFAVYKTVWIDKLGGFDTQFRCSREDSDTIIRMELCGLNMIQSWNACVYHFTCVSSRGTDWYEQDKQAQYKNILQSQADQQELRRFIRKWGFFGHHPKPVYDIAFELVLDQFVDLNLLEWLEPYVSRLYLDKVDVCNILINTVEFKAHYFSNLRWGYTPDYWSKVRHLFNPTDFSKRIIHSNDEAVEGDIVVSVNYSQLMDNIKEYQSFIENLNNVIDQNEVGMFEYGPFRINIKTKRDLSKGYAKHNDIGLLLSEEQFEFV